MDKMVGVTIITAGFLGILVCPVAAQDPGAVAQPVLPYVVDYYYPDRENQNAEFLGQYPQIHGYPHIFVLESDGTFLHSQDTAVLEEGRTYNEGALLEFLKEWVPPVS